LGIRPAKYCSPKLEERVDTEPGPDGGDRPAELGERDPRSLLEGLEGTLHRRGEDAAEVADDRGHPLRGLGEGGVAGAPRAPGRGGVAGALRAPGGGLRVGGFGH
jgi:hypothetical protein